MIENNLLIWSLVLVIGFPVSIVILGEIIHRLKRRANPLAGTLQIVRNLTLPVLAFMLFMQYVIKLDPDSNLVKTVQTLLWICAINAALSLLNVILFEQAEADTWRARFPKLLVDLSRLVLILMGTAIALSSVWNTDIAGLVTALGVSSIVIGFALQDTLGSVISGIALLFERPFNVGDWLKVGDLVGTVTDINWRSVRLQTFDRELIIIPHKVISGETITNFSHPWRIHAERIQIGFSYTDPPNLAKQVLKSTALSTQGILSDPEPEIFTLSYDDHCVNYEVKFFIQSYGDVEKIRDSFMTRIWYAAQRNNLTIPFPIRTLYHFHGPTSRAEGISKKFAESLQSIPSFVPLDKEKTNLDTQSQGVVLHHFGAGEKVIQQGYPGNNLYIIVSGKALLTIKDESGWEHEVLPLESGDFFGEMSLFSGEPSAVSVSAIEDLEVMIVSATVVNQMIERQPSFAREISQILEVRRKAIQIKLQSNLAG